MVAARDEVGVLVAGRRLAGRTDFRILAFKLDLSLVSYPKEPHTMNNVC